MHSRFHFKGQKVVVLQFGGLMLYTHTHTHTHTHMLRNKRFRRSSSNSPGSWNHGGGEDELLNIKNIQTIILSLFKKWGWVK